MKEKLTIFDLGMHNGDDTSYYLERGFKVVGVEANAALCDECDDRFRSRIRDGDLCIVNKALAESDDRPIEFWISSLNTEWSSVRWDPEALGEDPKRVTVETTTLRTLLSEFGLPHYVKCDLEGSDVIFCRQLVKEKIKPDFVSVEATSLELLALLMSAGYDTFQLINNAKVRRYPPRRRFDNPVYGDAHATIAGHCSGEFGFDLPPGKWISFAETSYRWLKHVDLRTDDPDTTLDNWFDFHATTGAVLNGKQAAADRVSVHHEQTDPVPAHDERSHTPGRFGIHGLETPRELEGRNRMLRRALDERDRTLARRDDEIMALIAEREENNRLLAEHRRETMALVAKREESSRLLAERHREIMALVAEREESNRLLAERHREIMALVERLEGIWASRSWRLTRPLRALGRMRSSP